MEGHGTSNRIVFHTLWAAMLLIYILGYLGVMGQNILLVGYYTVYSLLALHAIGWNIADRIWCRRHGLTPFSTFLPETSWGAFGLIILLNIFVYISLGSYARKFHADASVAQACAAFGLFAVIGILYGDIRTELSRTRRAKVSRARKPQQKAVQFTKPQRNLVLSITLFCMLGIVHLLSQISAVKCGAPYLFQALNVLFFVLLWLLALFVLGWNAYDRIWARRHRLPYVSTFLTPRNSKRFGRCVFATALYFCFADMPFKEQWRSFQANGLSKIQSQMKLSCFVQKWCAIVLLILIFAAYYTSSTKDDKNSKL